MINLIKVGRLFYGLSIIVYGIQQIVIRDFRPQILPAFPACAHQYSVFPIVTGVAMVIIGLMISGLFKVGQTHTKKVCVYVGLYFVALVITCQLPYLFFIFPHKLIHVGVWADLLKELAFSGGAFIMAGSYLNNLPITNYNNHNNTFDLLLGKLILIGRLFFCTTMILFGYCHFLYDLSGMVPKWFGMPTFWVYFGGVALIGAGVAILFKVFLKPVGLLLAVMLFLWFILLHIPNAIADPYVGRGNQVVSAFDALLFCGTALIISQYNTKQVTIRKKWDNELAY